MPYSKKKSHARKYATGHKFRSAKKPVTFEAKVKKIVQGTAEKKTSGGNPAAIIWPTDNNSNPTPVSLVSVAAGGAGPIAQGVAEQQRVGNKLKVTKATLKFILTPSSSSSYPALVQVFIGTMKGNKMTAPTSAELADIYQDGSSQASFDATRLSLLRNVNRDLFTINRRMQLKVGPANSATNANNDFPLLVRKTIALPSLMGTWIFNDAPDTTPNNKELFIWCTATNMLDGSVITQINMPTLEYYTVIEYTDF